jgi:hypothetical protein
MTTTAGHSFYIGPIGFFYNQVNDTGSWEPLVGNGIADIILSIEMYKHGFSFQKQFNACQENILSDNG